MTSPFPQIASPPQASAEVLVNEALETLQHQALFGKNHSTTSGLTWGYYGGEDIFWGGFEIADGTVVLTPSATNYLVVAIASGVLSASTSATNWNNSTDYARVYKITTTASAVDTAEDHRAGPGGVHGGSGGTGGGGGGGMTGLSFTSSTTTTDSDPGTGVLRWNNATQASATILYIDNADADSTSLATYWASLQAGTFLKITDAADADVWQLFKVSTVTPGTGYYKFAVTLQAQEGGNIANATDILLDVDASAVATTFTGGTLTSAINNAPPVTIASSTTPAIFAAAGNTINMTGVVTVTGFDTIAAGAQRTVIFAGALQLTHNATSMINLTGANLTTVAGDVAEFESLGSGNTKMLSYSRKDGTALAGASATPVGLHAVPVVAGAMRPSLTGGCSSLALIATTANLPDISSLDFDASTEEYAQFIVPMPKSWDEGTITAKFVWSHPATTTNFAAVWAIQAVATSDGDAIAAAFGTAQTVTDTGGTTNSQYVSAATSAVTIAGSPAAEDVVHFRVYRKSADGSDTLAVDARLHAVILFITTDAGNDA